MSDEVECPEYEAIIKFFTPQKYYCGGPIPRHLLAVPKNIPVLKIELAEAISIAHAALDRVRVLAKSKYHPKIGQQLIPKIIHATHGYNIRKEMIGGLILMYLELCEGCNWRHLVNEDFQLKCAKVGSS